MCKAGIIALWNIETIFWQTNLIYLCLYAIIRSKIEHGIDGMFGVNFFGETHTARINYQRLIGCQIKCVCV